MKGTPPYGSKQEERGQLTSSSYTLCSLCATKIHEIVEMDLIPKMRDWVVQIVERGEHLTSVELGKEREEWIKTKDESEVWRACAMEMFETLRSNFSVGSDTQELSELIDQFLQGRREAVRRRSPTFSSSTLFCMGATPDEKGVESVPNPSFSSLSPSVIPGNSFSERTTEKRSREEAQSSYLCPPAENRKYMVPCSSSGVPSSSISNGATSGNPEWEYHTTHLLPQNAPHPSVGDSVKREEEKNQRVAKKTKTETAPVPQEMRPCPPSLTTAPSMSAVPALHSTSSCSASLPPPPPPLTTTTAILSSPTPLVPQKKSLERDHPHDFSILGEREKYALQTHKEIRSALRSSALQSMIRAIDSSSCKLDALNAALKNDPYFKQFYDTTLSVILQAQEEELRRRRF